MSTLNKNSASLRVLHGGGWYNYDPSGVRAANPDWDAVSTRDSSLGFRCALPVRIPRV